VLTDVNHNEQFDINGEKIICDGKWSAPANIAQFQAAIREVHTNRKNTGPYTESCEECWIEEKKIPRGSGCINHRAVPHLWRKGDPMTEKMFCR
jgi:hypothetical protein